jgi:hypothetical protein
MTNGGGGAYTLISDATIVTNDQDRFRESADTLKEDRKILVDVKNAQEINHAREKQRLTDIDNSLNQEIEELDAKIRPLLEKKANAEGNKRYYQNEKIDIEANREQEKLDFDINLRTVNGNLEAVKEEQRTLNVESNRIKEELNTQVDVLNNSLNIVHATPATCFLAAQKVIVEEAKVIFPQAKRASMSLREEK